MTHTERPIDWERVEEMTLALLYLTTFDEGLGGARAWKRHSFEVMDRLHNRGWIANPKGQAKSVALTEEGERKSRELFEGHFVGPPIL
jgi:Domain of unknown function (DUF6429)